LSWHHEPTVAIVSCRVGEPNGLNAPNLDERDGRINQALSLIDLGLVGTDIDLDQPLIGEKGCLE
jgi:hypothetical protein